MQKHEQKICSKCNAAFECKVGSIHLCQCSAILLTEVERYYIQQQYNDCLCINCLKEIQSLLMGDPLKQPFKKIN